MDKSTYYVSVQSRSVLTEQGASPYEWEIEATPEEADQVRIELDMLQEKEEEAFPGYVFPWPDTPEQSTNTLFQTSLDRVYRTIYRLGTPETRQQMEELRLLSELT
ncbi:MULTISPECIES: hypothetical protein [Paenibacillus]|jgi:hypothetical protein|uniref:Uncharacterized protein n=2 Tax=Paenibacillus lactis TaxID=228574 RepID=G4HHY5_9BACL|nr:MULTISPECIES: hypothetical protein [Paenibacillus]EHB62958.1 hypothetical protein PaelaDRAFT_3596 [Paenibacillus lactis 154]MBP1894685.1 hypothetical protein [Paenibacillus lactis]MCM3495768.1 hypothetical protein [Paenibacillus lactis]GIO92880.1 hypothetical protein J31TS3_41070 [Paenibacillus lactis]HAG00152.1 hypothetical protein [Paenibacillus lactis]